MKLLMAGLPGGQKSSALSCSSHGSVIGGSAWLQDHSEVAPASDG